MYIHLMSYIYDQIASNTITTKSFERFLHHLIPNYFFNNKTIWVTLESTVVGFSTWKI